MDDVKKLTLFGICSLIFLFSPAFIHGQSVTVMEARILPNDSWVTLSGNVINALPGGINYTFCDSSGEIIVEICSRVWRGLSVAASDRV